MFTEKKRPEVLSTKTLIVALLIHMAFFSAFWIFSIVNFKPKEVVIPIDLTVVVNENLDGKENEPPPLEESEPEPPPEPKPEVKVEPPPKVENVEAVEVVKEPETEKKSVKKVEKKPEKKPAKKPALVPHFKDAYLVSPKMKVRKSAVGSLESKMKGFSPLSAKVGL